MPHRFGQIRVWDRPVRLFHWSLASSVTAALASGWLGFGQVHAVAGYAATIVLVLRIGWGFFGSHYARFANFHLSPAGAAGYLRDLTRGRAARYVGHNPAASMMVVTLIGLGLLIAATGLLTDGVINLEGPFGFLFLHTNDHLALTVKHLHAALPFGIAALVVLHIAGVLASGRQHGENLIAAMVSGMKPVVTAVHRDLPCDAAIPDLVVTATGAADEFALADYSDTHTLSATGLRAQRVPVGTKRGVADT